MAKLKDLHRVPLGHGASALLDKERTNAELV